MKKQLKKLMNNLISGLQTGLGLFLLLCTTSISAQYNYDNQYYGEQDDNRYSKNASGLAGDNFSLEGALELFRQSSSPEAFEKALNDERNNVNNLDLDNNGYIDYLRVIDRMQGAVHAVVIQALLGRNDVQDIAVIEIEKKNRDEIAIQIVGDEDIYGENVIIEPRRPEYDDNWYGYQNQYRYVGNNYYSRRYAYYNAYDWPLVQYIYSPRYVVWVSPWAWTAYPSWYNRWRPWQWNDFYDRCYHYRNHYVVIYQPAVYRARDCYNPHRAHSEIVSRNYGQRIKSYRADRTPVAQNQGGYRLYDRTVNSGVQVASSDSRQQRGNVSVDRNDRINARNNTSDRKSQSDNSKDQFPNVQERGNRMSDANAAERSRASRQVNTDRDKTNRGTSVRLDRKTESAPQRNAGAQGNRTVDRTASAQRSSERSGINNKPQEQRSSVNSRSERNIQSDRSAASSRGSSTRQSR